jgi:phospholipid/cholesterol/gamma-HCH transport system substrate-binding protein
MTRSLTRVQALLQGGVVAIALAVGVWALWAIPSQATWDSFEATTNFTDVHGLRPGTRVHLQGVDVGEVTAVALPDVAGEPVRVRLRLVGSVRSRLGADAKVKIAQDNPMGDRLVRLLPGRPDGTRIADGAVLAAAESPDLFDGLAQASAKATAVLARFDTILAEVEKGNGTLGKLLKDENLYAELAGASKDIRGIVREVRDGEGTIGKLVKDQAAYDETVQAVKDIHEVAVSVKQNSDAVKSMPIIRSFVVDAHKELVRPDRKRMRKVFGEDELFEPGQAILTDAGRAKLDGVAQWLKTYKAGDIVVAGIAPPRSEPTFAQTLTQKQSEAVTTYLKSSGVQRTGYWWWSTRPVKAIGCGNHPPAQPEAEELPASRVEVVLFLPPG